MTQKKLFCVTDCWTEYQVVSAADADSAVRNVYSKKAYKLIPPNALTDRTVIHVTCCSYGGFNKYRIDRCSNDIDKILSIDTLPETLHYQIS